MSAWSTEIAQQRYDQLDAEEAMVNAKLKEAKADNNKEYGVELAVDLEGISLRKQALIGRHQQYLNEQAPRAPVPQTDQEWLSKAPEKMDYNDVARIAAKSKYGFDYD